MLVYNKMFNYITTESDNQIISAVVSAVAACCGLATLWLALEEEQSRKKTSCLIIVGQDMGERTFVKRGASAS